MNKKYILPIIVLAVGNLAALMLFFSEPEPKKRERKIHLPVVETQPLKQQDYTVKIRSSGKVRAHTRTNLVAEVSGKIIVVADGFETGESFKQGDILLQIDDSDYVNAVTVARAEVQQQKLTLKEEQARARLARKDWNLLDSKEKPNELVTRKPHIESAESALAAAEARLKQAKMNLERTYIRAPYAGRVLNRDADLGQYVAAGTKLGSIYATDKLEVNLPVSLQQYEQLDLSRRLNDPNNFPIVNFFINQGKQSYNWSGRVIRSSAALDAGTNQITIIAHIDAPYKTDNPSSPPVKIGQFMRAEIEGRTYQNVYIVPRESVRQNKEVLLFNDGVVEVKPVSVIRVSGNQAVIKADFSESEKYLITTPMPLARSGLKVKRKNDKSSDTPENKKVKPNTKPDEKAPSETNKSEKPS